MSEENKSTKGEIGGICNRTACQKQGADWFNHSTVKFYCEECALLINEANQAEAHRIFGHELCCKHEPEERIITKSSCDDIHTRILILENYIDYFGCNPGDVNGQLRIVIDDYSSDGIVKRTENITPFSSKHEQNVLSESEAIRYLKYSLAKVILESILDAPVVIPNFIVKDDQYE